MVKYLFYIVSLIITFSSSIFSQESIKCKLVDIDSNVELRGGDIFIVNSPRKFSCFNDIFELSKGEFEAENGNINVFVVLPGYISNIFELSTSGDNVRIIGLKKYDKYLDELTKRTPRIDYVTFRIKLFNEKNEPISGVPIRIVGMPYWTVSNIQGQGDISVNIAELDRNLFNEKKVTFVANGIGYETQMCVIPVKEFSAGIVKEINIELKRLYSKNELMSIFEKYIDRLELFMKDTIALNEICAFRLSALDRIHKLEEAVFDQGTNLKFINDCIYDLNQMIYSFSSKFNNLDAFSLKLDQELQCLNFELRSLVRQNSLINSRLGIIDSQIHFLQTENSQKNSDILSVKNDVELMKGKIDYSRFSFLLGLTTISSYNLLHSSVIHNSFNPKSNFSKISAFLWLGKRSDFSFSYDKYLFSNNNIHSIFGNVKIMNAASSNLYGLFGLGVYFKDCFNDCSFVVQLPIFYDFINKDKYKLSGVLQYFKTLKIGSEGFKDPSIDCLTFSLSYTFLGRN